ncbi:2-phosphosulfolactate phosphatase [Phenylobacterium sp.]|uniref:2-phosphosulfolactate phosphatase n=1 Tax=Phenylobacterium sp. TaxID=1871053 RepID=UPI00271694BF|nr:2-phosphosulfolactate phosphatase [Phenylobacterium sp.]MDO8802261.1 2-phosphosulfolactate phosphatase [Phenylobacterium sp.]
MIRCEWAREGIEALRPHVSVLVIVDVLSFSTAVDIAVGRGALIYPFPLGDFEAAQAAAAEVGAMAAAPKRAAGGQFSLSPASLRHLNPGDRLLLPSPNGSRLSLACGDIPVLAGCLRNARTVAAKARDLAGHGDIGLIPAGERWPGDTLRPAIEDLIGAGAIIDALDGAMTAEARVARDAWRSAAPNLEAVIRDSLSGRELIERGFAIDVDLALQSEASAVAPMLRDGAYIAG